MDAPFTLTFRAFWEWVTTHPNCIVRAGTPEAVLYDDDDLHWHFTEDADGTLLVQLLHGKRMLGELFVEAEHVSYVEAVPQEQEDEHPFELISEASGERFAPYFFVMAHGYDEEPMPSSSRTRVH